LRAIPFVPAVALTKPSHVCDPSTSSSFIVYIARRMKARSREFARARARKSLLHCYSVDESTSHLTGRNAPDGRTDRRMDGRDRRLLMEVIWENRDRRDPRRTTRLIPPSCHGGGFTEGRELIRPSPSCPPLTSKRFMVVRTRMMNFLRGGYDTKKDRLMDDQRPSDLSRIPLFSLRPARAFNRGTSDGSDSLGRGFDSFFFFSFFFLFSSLFLFLFIENTRRYDRLVARDPRELSVPRTFGESRLPPSISILPLPLGKGPRTPPPGGERGGS